MTQNNKLKQFLKSPFVLSISSSILLCLSIPPNYFGFLFIVAFIPLFYILETKISLIKKLLFIWLTFFLLRPLTSPSFIFLDSSFGSQLFIVTSYLFYAGLMVLPFLVFQITRKHLPLKLQWISFPFYWVAYEFLLNQSELALNLYNLGLNLGHFPAAIQFYEITGLSGGSLVILVFNVLIYTLIKNLSNKDKRNKLIKSLGILVISLIGINFYLSSYTDKSTKNHKIAIIQPNFDNHEKVTKEIFEKRFELLGKLSYQLKDEQPDLIVWPESVLQGVLFDIDHLDKNKYIKAMNKLSSMINAPIVSGMLSVEYHQSKKNKTSISTNKNIYFDVYNAAIMTDGTQNVQCYVKNKCVPFIERVPYLNFFSILEKLHINLGSYLPSYRTRKNEQPFKTKQFNIAPMICLESIYPSYLASCYKENFNLIVIPTNDGWFKFKTEMKWHIRTTVPLAISYRKPVIMASNNGSSLFIDHKGKQKRSSRFNVQKSLIDKVSINNSETFYARNGDWLGKAALFFSGIIVIFAFIKTKFLKQ